MQFLISNSFLSVMCHVGYFVIFSYLLGCFALIRLLALFGLFLWYFAYLVYFRLRAF